MPSINTIVINDGAATPVAHTFAPTRQDGSKAVFHDRSAAIPAGFGKIEHEITEPKAPGAAHRVKIGFYIPEVGVVDGETVVVRNNSASLTLNFSPNSTDADRKNMRMFIQNYLTNSSVRTSVDNLEPWF
jgi:hypothetical protein